MVLKTLILGGARSGKSRFALNLGERVPGRKAFIATAEALDPEMAERIRQHRNTRSTIWETIEEPLKLCDLFTRESKAYQLFLVDCLTLWLSNMMHADGNPMTVSTEIDSLAKFLRTTDRNIILVSNEVGWGIVPESSSTRKFRDLAGLMNQNIAEAADAVYLVSAGIPVKIK